MEIEKVYLTGGVSYLERIVSAFQEELNFPTQLLDCSQFFTFGKQIKEKFQTESRCYYPSLGLSISHILKNPLKINLIPQAEKQKKELKQIKTKLSIFIVLAFIFLSALFFNIGYEINLKKDKINAAKEKLNYYQQFAEHIGPIEEELYLYHARLDTIIKKNKKRYLLHQALKTITKKLPGNIWFQSIRYERDGSLTLSGICAGTLADINFYKDNLEKTNVFSNISINEANIAILTDDTTQAKRTFILRMLLNSQMA